MESESHQQLGYGLLRFRSAPSSLLTNETEKFTSRFLSYGNNNSNSGGPMYEEKSPSSVKESPAAVSPRGYSGLPPHYPRPSSGMGSSAMDGSYGLVSSITVDHHHSQPKSVTSNLTRQNSSPPDLFSHLSPQNGYAPGRGTGNFRGASGFNGEISPSSNRLKGQTSFSSGLPSSLGMLSQISEFGSENLGSADARLGVGNLDTRFCGPAFPFNSWSDSSHLSENFTGLKRERENDVKMFSGGQNGEIGNRHTMLSHHLSLPRTSSEMVAVEKFLQLQDSVPCKIRAKRGCATHPRSIAERVRRTRISERMRKLQELVPNMDKQTNTADMLDLAVDYIKDLQKQFKTLSDNRANCKCLSMQKPV